MQSRLAGPHAPVAEPRNSDAVLRCPPVRAKGLGLVGFAAWKLLRSDESDPVWSVNWSEQGEHGTNVYGLW